jgi:hypothetical protein
MNPLVTLGQTPCDVKYLPNNMCQVTFTIHQQEITMFQLIFETLSVVFKNLAWKAKTNIDAVHQRISDNQLKNDAIVFQYESEVVDMFKAQSQQTISPREAFSLTVSLIKQNGLLPHTIKLSKF